MGKCILFGTGTPPCRHVLVAMGFFALFNCFTLRFELSVAIVAMVNLTYVREYDAAAQRLLNSSDVGSSRYHSDDLCVTADENTTDVVDDKVCFICIFNRINHHSAAYDYKVRNAVLIASAIAVAVTTIDNRMRSSTACEANV